MSRRNSLNKENQPVVIHTQVYRSRRKSGSSSGSSSRRNSYGDTDVASNALDYSAKNRSQYEDISHHGYQSSDGLGFNSGVHYYHSGNEPPHVSHPANLHQRRHSGSRPNSRRNSKEKMYPEWGMQYCENSSQDSGYVSNSGKSRPASGRNSNSSQPGSRRNSTSSLDFRHMNAASEYNVNMEPVYQQSFPQCSDHEIKPVRTRRRNSNSRPNSRKNSLDYSYYDGNVHSLPFQRERHTNSRPNSRKNSLDNGYYDNTGHYPVVRERPIHLGRKSLSRENTPEKHWGYDHRNDRLAKPYKDSPERDYSGSNSINWRSNQNDPYDYVNHPTQGGMKVIQHVKSRRAQSQESNYTVYEHDKSYKDAPKSEVGERCTYTGISRIVIPNLQSEMDSEFNYSGLNELSTEENNTHRRLIALNRPVSKPPIQNQQQRTRSQSFDYGNNRFDVIKTNNQNSNPVVSKSCDTDHYNAVYNTGDRSCHMINGSVNAPVKKMLNIPAELLERPSSNSDLGKVLKECVITDCDIVMNNPNDWQSQYANVFTGAENVPHCDLLREDGSKVINSNFQGANSNGSCFIDNRICLNTSVDGQKLELEGTPVRRRRRSRGRRRRSKSKDYGVDQFDLSRRGSSESSDCPLDSIDLEKDDWRECLVKCIENLETDSAKEKTNIPECSTSSSSLSWGEQMEQDNNFNDLVKIEGEKNVREKEIHDKFSEIKNRVLSPGIGDAVTVISHHPISPPICNVTKSKSLSNVSSLDTTTLIETQLQPVENQRRRRRHSRNYNYGIEPLSDVEYNEDYNGVKQKLNSIESADVSENNVDDDSQTNTTNTLGLPKPRQRRTRSLSVGNQSELQSSGINSGLSNVYLAKDPECDCDIMTLHTHEVNQYAQGSGPDIPTSCNHISSPIQEPSYVPRVLHPRRRRAKSQDFGSPQQNIAASNNDLFMESKPVKKCGSLNNISESLGPKANITYKDNLDDRFQELLDTYLFGSDGNMPSGKIVRRKLKDKKKNPPRQRLKEPEENVAKDKSKQENTIPASQKPTTPSTATKIEPTKIEATNAAENDEPKANKRDDPPPQVIVVPPSPKEPTPSVQKAEEKKQPLPKEEKPIQVDVKIENEVDDQSSMTAVALENAKNIEEDKENKLENDENVPESKPKKSVELKYEYKEDQWSPLNNEGKKAYDRTFLLQMQYGRQSVTKPAGLPDLPELILDSPNPSSRSSAPGETQFRRSDMGANLDFTPGYIRGVPGPRGMPMPKSRSREQRGGPRGEPRKVISINREPEVQLQKSENPYKPGFKQSKEQKEEKAESKTEELYRKIRSILNKLTPQKFQVLMQQILELEINTEERLSESINIIFEKAIDEPAFSVAYANACKIMAGQLHVVSETNPNEKVTFKKLLLNRCQTEFEKDKKEALEMQQMQQAIDKAESEAEKKLLTEEMRLAESKAKRRSLGNIRFIGELFKLSMLTERIMHDCIMNLLKATDEESLECLCRLVSTVGKSLDHDKAKPLMDQYFAKIDKIIKIKQTSARTRFMLQDLTDLRLCRWKPRRDDNAPKTIEQIHKEAAEEKVEKGILHQRLAQESRNMPRGGNPRGGRGGMQQSTDEHGWQSVGPVKSYRLDPSKMKISKTNVDESNITLGPGRSFGGWGRGSTGGGKNASQEGEKPSTPGNRFSALSGGGSQQNTGAANTENDSRRGNAMSRGGMSQGGRDSRGRLAPRQQNSRSYSRGSQDKERDAAIQAARNISAGRGDSDRLTPGNSRNQSRESSRNRDLERRVESPAPVPLKDEMDKETVERKSKSTIDEYLSIHDLKEAIECTKEIPGSLMHIFGATAIQHVLERSGVARRMTGTLLHDLVKNNVLSVEQYLQGLKETLEFAEDMEIDIPKIWQYLGELIGPMVQDGSVPLVFLKSACEPLLDNNKAGLLISEVLNDASHRLGHVKVGEQWKNSGLVWTDFMKSDAVQDFISTHKLEYTVESDQPLSPVGKGLSEEKIQMELDNLIKVKGVENEKVFDWVVINVGESNTKKPSFIRALMTSVCSSAIVGSVDKATVDAERLKKHGNLLQKYMDHDAVLELQALYALQALVHKLQHPPDVLRILFDLLYDEDIISEDAFNQWESSDDPAEQLGKGVARSSVVQFYRWLREAEEAEEEEQ